MTEFATILGEAFDRIAGENGFSYIRGGAYAWGIAGAAYLSFASSGLTPEQLRAAQYKARDEYGPVILECKWYDRLKDELFKGKDSVDALLPDKDGRMRLCPVTAELFLEMLDFCREG